jgi:hypothetical protein
MTKLVQGVTKVVNVLSMLAEPRPAGRWSPTLAGTAATMVGGLGRRGRRAVAMSLAGQRHPGPWRRL